MKYFISILLFSIIEFLGCGKNNNVSSTYANHPPVISSLTATPDSVGPGESSLLRCNATDQDNDSLKYTWSYTSGNINGVGSQVTWTSPSSLGTYAISCVVEDGKGGQDMDSLSIPVVQKIPIQGLVGYWPFNGNANDESGNGNNGTVYGTTFTSDRFGNNGHAIYFNGNNAYIDIPSNLKGFGITNKFTIAFWIKSNDISGRQMILEDGVQFNVSSFYCGTQARDNKFMLRLNTNVGSYFNDYIAINEFKQKWTFFVYIYDGTKIILNENVNDVFNHSISGDIISGNRDLRIGYPSGEKFYNGIFDDFRIYNRVLTDSEILLLYHEGSWQ